MRLALRALQPGDNIARFSLGDAAFTPLKTFLKKDAQRYHSQDITKTYVLVEKGEVRVLGYVSLVCSQIELSGRHSIDGFPYKEYPCLKIVRLAVDKTLKGQGLGKGLVSWAVSITKQRVMPHVGCRFLVVDSKQSSIDFYLKCGFTLLDTPSNNALLHPLLFIDLHKI